MMVKELRRKGVTLQLLWEEYLRAHPDGYQNSQFCYHFHRWVFGSEATLRYALQSDELYAARRGDADFNRIDIPEAERGVWRAEEEFISAIRGNEVVTYTDFVHGVRYMEFTEAVHRSIREQRTVAVPFQ